ncbi:MAG: PEP-CTERM sorting domain-containing protein [Opitutaceae bacterium]|jgi:hypothetical protein|nr:PEP-CTERM sorting domain-containing protein [Opitutaceae bacterium]
MKTILRHRLRATVSTVSAIPAIPAIATLVALLATILAAFAPSARAALEIQKSDITEANDVFTYNYSFTYADMIKMITDAGKDYTQNGAVLTSGGKFFDDIFSASSDIRLMVEKGGDAFIHANSKTVQSSFTYKFDLANAGYEITSFTVTDRLYAANQDRAIVTQYSTDGATWTDTDGNLTNILRATTSITSGTFSNGTSPVITLASGVSTLYYRVVFTSLNGEATQFYSQQSWNRLNTQSGNSGFFEVNITLAPASIPGPTIPEPATIPILAGIGALGSGLFHRHRSRRD